jgi:hypothetical protein
MFTAIPRTLITHKPPKIKRMAFAISYFDFKKRMNKYVPIPEITKTRPTNIADKENSIFFMAIYWINVDKVVYVTINPDVPETTSGKRPKERRAKLIACPDPIPSVPCKIPAEKAPPMIIA